MFSSAVKPPGSRRGLVVLAGLTLAAAVLGGGSYLYSARSRPPATASSATADSPATAAALARVRELEARVAELERDKAALEAAVAASEREPVSAPVSPGEPVDADGPDVVHPTLLREGPPAQYPAEARSHGRRALVVVEALVGEDGSVLETRALESSVAGMGFEEAAQRRVEASLYRPATRRGVPVRVRIRVPVEFIP
jgi:TonB family protein